VGIAQDRRAGVNFDREHDGHFPDPSFDHTARDTARAIGKDRSAAANGRHGNGGIVCGIRRLAHFANFGRANRLFVTPILVALADRDFVLEWRRRSGSAIYEAIA